jgi:chromosome segregation ATPase
LGFVQVWRRNEQMLQREVLEQEALVCDTQQQLHAASAERDQLATRAEELQSSLASLTEEFVAYRHAASANEAQYAAQVQNMQAAAADAHVQHVAAFEKLSQELQAALEHHRQETAALEEKLASTVAMYEADFMAKASQVDSMAEELTQMGLASADSSARADGRLRCCCVFS